MNKVMNHAEYQRSLKTKTVEQLHFIIKDCREALRAMPDNPNAGYYLDEISYAAMEIKQRNMAS